jgi:type IV secretion system protein VirB2
MKRETLFCLFSLIVLSSLILFDSSLAHASAGSGGGLPYEAALTKVEHSVTGPVAYTLSILGIVGAGGILIFGGDLSGFFRTMVILVLVIGVMVSSANVLQTLFGHGATLAQRSAVTSSLVHRT